MQTHPDENILKVLILFGASSDEFIYQKIQRELSEEKHFAVSFTIISAHRNPDQLKLLIEEKKKNDQVDVIIAGAGLAAHLPGVAAAFSLNIPVIGIPVPASFRGLDSLAAILQMPYGVPVLTYPSDQFLPLKNILTALLKMKHQHQNQNQNQQMVVSVRYIGEKNRAILREDEKLKKEWQESLKLANYLGLEVSEEIEFSEDGSSPEEKIDYLQLFFQPNEHIKINIPLMDLVESKKAQNFFPLFQQLNQSHELWVGVNNIKNAIMGLVQLKEMGRKNPLFSSKLQQIRQKKIFFHHPQKLLDCPLRYQGSVKDVYAAKESGVFYFHYSDRYSVFDWGEMPDEIKGKGQALCEISFFLFQFLQETKSWQEWDWRQEVQNKDRYPYLTKITYGLDQTLKELRQQGVCHHLLQDQDDDEELKSHHILKVKAVQVLPPYLDGRINYQAYQQKPLQTLIPLEVIFRWGLPKGSSLHKRIKNQEYLQKLGFLPQQTIMEGDHFDFPVIEFSTKLESYDRFLSEEEAQQSAGLSDEEMSELKALTFLISCRLKTLFTAIDPGLHLMDGKLEFAFTDKKENGQRKMMLVDGIGPDELRINFQGVALSKEFLRTFYQRTSWYEKVELSKKMKGSEGEWKKYCGEVLQGTPPHLPTEYKETAEMMYQVLAQLLSKNLQSPHLSRYEELKILQERILQLEESYE